MRKIVFLSFYLLLIYSCKKKPVADFSYSDITKAGIEIQFTNSSTNSESAFWEFGDESTSYDLSPKHIYARPGIYTVKLEVTGEDGSASTSKEVIITGTSYLFKNSTRVPLYNFCTFHWNGTEIDEFYSYGTFPIEYQTQEVVTDNLDVYCGFQYPSGGTHYISAEPYALIRDTHNNIILINQTNFVSTDAKSITDAGFNSESLILQYMSRVGVTLKSTRPD